MAVAGHHVACGDGLRPGRGGDRDAGAVGVLGRRGRGHAAVDGTAERGEAVGEEALGDVLGDHQDVVVGRRQPGEADRQQRPVAVAHGETVELQAARGQRFDDAERREHVEGVGVDDSGPGGVLSLGQAVDQQVVDTGLLQGDGEGEAGRAGADDENIGTGRKHDGDSIVNVC